MIATAWNEKETRGLLSELPLPTDKSNFCEKPRLSFEELPYEAPRKEASPISDGDFANSFPDQSAEENDSRPLPWEHESEIDDLHQVLVKSPSMFLGKTSSVGHRTSSTVDLHKTLGRNEKNLPKTRNSDKRLSKEISLPNTASPLHERHQDFQETHRRERNLVKRHDKRVEPRARRRSSVHTENSNAFRDELLHLSSDSILKRARERIKQCKDIPVALKHFLKTQTDPRYSIEEVVAIYDQLKKTGIMMKGIVITAKKAHEERILDNRTNSDIDILIANLGKCLDMLETDFELFEITHMDIESQQKTWDEMLLSFERRNSNSLLDHLQITCSFGIALLASLRAGSGSSHESDELKATLLDTNQIVPESSLMILPRRRPSSKTSIRRPRRTRRDRLRPYNYPYDSDVFSSSEAGRIDDRQRERLESRHKMDRQNQYVSSPTPVEGEQFLPSGAVNWLWICQADIIPGYFATPWKGLFSEAVCIGAISTILKCLDALTDSSTRRYVETQIRCQDWIRAGNSTYPSYALNAKGGVVISGVYEPVPFARFPSHLPPIELLSSYDHQVRRGVRHQNQQPCAIVDDLAELMGLDTWLSLCGRTPAIYDGPSNLLRTLPALAQRILSDFEYEFANLDRTTSTDGGFQLIQTVAESLTEALVEQSLSEPEQLFAMVAFLRAAQTALCVVRGSDTAGLRDVLEHDIQVYLA